MIRKLSKQLRMFDALSDGYDALKQSVQVLYHHPRFLVPLLVCWLIYAPLIIYVKYYLPWDRLSVGAAFAVCFGVVALMSFLLGGSCLVLLELVQQIETTGRASVGRATLDAFANNLIKAMPILIIWSVLWFVLLIIQAIISKGKDRDSNDADASAENVARTLSGSGEGFSLSRGFFRAIQKAIRMIVFLMLPAIAWEGAGPLTAMKCGMGALRLHLSFFATGFVLSEVAAIAIFAPPGLLISLADESEIAYPEWVWVGIIIYSAFAWSFVMFIEQMFAAELYLWHLKWREVCRFLEPDAKLPRLRDIPQPSIMDEVREFTLLKDFPD